MDMQCITWYMQYFPALVATFVLKLGSQAFLLSISQAHDVKMYKKVFIS